MLGASIVFSLALSNYGSIGRALFGPEGSETLNSSAIYLSSSCPSPSSPVDRYVTRSPSAPLPLPLPIDQGETCRGLLSSELLRRSNVVLVAVEQGLEKDE